MAGLFKTMEEAMAYLAEYHNKMAGIKDLLDEEMPDAGPESVLQGKAQKWMDDHGFPWVHDRSRKKNRPGQILDLYCFLPAGRMEIFEFKSETGVYKDDQKKTIQRLLYLGHRVHKCKSFKRFKQIMEGKENEQH